ncbi:MAG: SDR family NAD(P)-dependent oxidoreductase [Gulosibacter sp.]|uniref:SDR family NAD(P)-dependent oxidoreductase n=1 Tax=Gulosibacter sp. TaxID=2817531 RepID=UPI003F93B6CE
MSRIFITGSTDGLGLLNAEHLQAAGHEVVVHARNTERRSAVQTLIDNGASVVIGDLANAQQTRDLVQQANDLGRMDAVIHNAGILDGPDVFAVNVLAPFILTAAMARPARLVYLTSGWHQDGHAATAALHTADGQHEVSYADSKLFVTTFAAAVARHWPEVRSNAVDPGWMPTKLGGSHATGNLDLGTRTQEWLAVSEDASARVSGEYWHYQERRQAHPAVHDESFQDELLDTLARITDLPFK